MSLDRRSLLGLGALVTLSGCTGAPLELDPSVRPPAASSSGATPSPTPSPTPTGPQLRKVPAPRFALAKAPGGGIDGNRLDRALSALPAYSGGAQRRIVVKPGTYSRSTPLVIPSGVHLVAAGSTFVSRIPGAQDPLVAIDNVSDVTVEGGTWDGKGDAVKIKTEWKHAIRVQNSRRITLTGLVAQNAKGDGIYVGALTWPCHDVTITSVKCRKNHRNGMSITGCSGLKCTDSIFTGNGVISPMAGADIEPHDPAAPIRDIRFTRCAFTQNSARGFLMVMDPGNPEIPGSVRLDKCTIEQNATDATGYLSAGMTLIRPRGIRITNTVVRGNNIGIVVQSRREKDPASQFGRGTVELNGVDVASSNRQGLLVLQGVRRLKVTDTRFLDSSRTEGDEFSGVTLANGSNMDFTDCVSSGARLFGLEAADDVRGVTLTRCDLSGNGKGEIDAPKSGVKVVQ
jgi:hypothetical protein